MMLVEQTRVPDAALPVAQFKDHLRLGSGFADDDLQDALLAGCLRAAMAVIEARTGKVVLARDYTWTLGAWRDLGAQVLPVAPVQAITQLRITNRLGEPAVIDPARYRLVADQHRPKMVASGFMLPTIPVAGAAEISFRAGFGAQWGDIPADLAHAVMLLAARYYELRDGAQTAPDMPFGVTALIERYRHVRLFGGVGR